MDFIRDNLKLLLLAAVLILAGLNPDKTKEIFNGLLSKFSPAANSGSAADAGSAPAGTSSEPAASPVSITAAEAQMAVESYMRRYTSPRAALSFLGWSNFSTSGPASAITLLYRVQNAVGDVIVATVRFTLQGGSVVKTEVIQPGLQPATALTIQRPRAPVVQDRFSGPLFSAMHGPAMALHLDSAFSLAQLDEAKRTAQAERKPLGFILVWGQFFDQEADPRSGGSVSALIHFYQVFNQQLVLVFVRHETELDAVPRAVATGFRGPDEGGFAPNMAVTDATATEFIVEIPFRNLDGAGRDQLFAAGGRVIDQWLATHPNAMPTPAPEIPAQNP